MPEHPYADVVALALVVQYARITETHSRDYFDAQSSQPHLWVANAELRVLKFSPADTRTWPFNQGGNHTGGKYCLRCQALFCDMCGFSTTSHCPTGPVRPAATRKPSSGLTRNPLTLTSFLEEEE